MEYITDTDYNEILRIVDALQKEENKEKITKRPSINDFLDFPLENDEEEPCKDCKFIDDCETSEFDCVAFRKWVNSGVSQRKKDIGRDRRRVIFSEETVTGY